MSKSLRSCAASMADVKTAASARHVLTCIENQIAVLRQLVPWPRLIRSWELELDLALEIMQQKGFA